jgi:hypothetical protein
MASIRQDRGAIFPEAVPGRRSVAMLVAALVVVLVGIVMISNFSRRQASAPPAAIENITPTEVQPTAAGPEPAPAVSPPVPADERTASTRKQAAIARAVEDGRPGLVACYQRALVKDDSLVHGKVTVRVSIAPSGRVETVGVHGAAPFRAMQPCLEKTIATWDFPAAPASYAAEFPLVLQGKQ